MTIVLRRAGYPVNRKRVIRLMAEMGLQAIYPKPPRSRPHPDHQVYPYLLRDVTVRVPDQVWSTDIMYIHLPGGFVYLAANPGLVQPQGLNVATVEHPGDPLLPGLPQ